MITREEALQTIHDCRITSIGELSHGYVVYQTTANTLINQLFDQLESQLSSNPLQLTCDGCVEKDNWKFNHYPMQCEYCELKPRKCYYIAKDTK